MYIVIAGAGLVGGTLATTLMGNKHDVVVIDSDKESCERLYAESGVVTVHGNAAEIGILKEAGVEKSEVVIGATGNDATNLAFALLCQSIAVPKVIVRMRNPSYENAYKLAGADSVVRVTDLLVHQVIFEVEQPDARRVTSLGRGQADMYSVLVPENGKIVGKKVMDIVKDSKFPEDCNFAAIYRKIDDKLTIPHGNQVIAGGDELFIIVRATELTRAVDHLTARK